MTIKETYDRFRVPPGLRVHMIRVAQFVNVVASAWSGETVDNDFLITCALVHDLGNIVVFKRWIGEETQNLAYWENIQREITDAYGTDDHEATRHMLQEVNTDSELVDLIMQKSSANSPKIAASDNWQLKILLYADLRIAPTGVASLADKLKEMYARSDKHKGVPGIPEALDEVERQLQQHSNRDLKSISERDFTLEETQLLRIKLPQTSL
jgi:hypothetical protein